MNIHVPQTEEARAEAACLMDVRQNMITPRSGAFVCHALRPSPLCGNDTLPLAFLPLQASP